MKLADKAIITCGLRLGTSKVLRSLRHFPREQNQGHHTIDHLEERGVERSGQRSSGLKGQERTIVNSDEYWNRFEGNARRSAE